MKKVVVIVLICVLSIANVFTFSVVAENSSKIAVNEEDYNEFLKIYRRIESRIAKFEDKIKEDILRPMRALAFSSSNYKESIKILLEIENQVIEYQKSLPGYKEPEELYKAKIEEFNSLITQVDQPLLALSYTQQFEKITSSNYPIESKARAMEQLMDSIIHHVSRKGMQSASQTLNRYNYTFSVEDDKFTMHWGETNISGHSIEIKRIEVDKNNALNVFYEMKVPSSKEIVYQDSKSLIMHTVTLPKEPYRGILFLDLDIEANRKTLEDREKGTIQISIKEKRGLEKENLIRNFTRQELLQRELKDRIYVNGNNLTYDVPPVIISNRTLVPIRAIAEGLGSEVFWDNNTQTVTILKDNTKIIIKLNSNLVYVNELQIKIDVPAQSIGGRTFVPLRFISEGLGINVVYDEITGDIDIDL